MAGGTGGHVFPGLAVAKELLQRGFSVEWLGTTKGLESKLVPAENIHLNIFPVSGIRGKGISTLLLAPFNILRALFSALKVLKKINPQLVIGMGGFVAGPGAIAAKLTGKPLLIHEQNAVAGTTNRVLHPIANITICAFPEALSGAKVLGNPVRREIQMIPSPEIRGLAKGKKIKVLIVGGSRGALAINHFLPKVFSQLKSNTIDNNNQHTLNFNNIDIWHQAGSGKDNETKAQYQALDISARVVAFIDDISKAYAWADLIICRSGALTVSEIATVGLGSILIPFPYAIDDHQTANAEYLRANSAAVVIQERDFDVTTFALQVQNIISNRQALLDMANNARAIAKPQACNSIANACEELLHA